MFFLSRNYNKLFIIILCCSSSISLLFDFYLSLKQMEQVFHQTDIFIFISTILLIISLIPRSLKKINFLIFLKTHWHALLLSFVFTFIMNLNYPPQFRILADETNLASIASSMYLNKDFYISLSGFNTYETYNNIHHVWGTRPLFFPFLISISHSLMGYNVENIFLFNFFFGFCHFFDIFYYSIVAILFWFNFLIFQLLILFLQSVLHLLVLKS